MRITIEAADDVADLTRARECIEAMLSQRAMLAPAVDRGARIDALGLSPRARNSLFAANILTVAELCAHTREELLRLRNLGPLSLDEIIGALAQRGLSLAYEDGGRDE
jgi:DNA-directed RNA polymerase alpha subunit